MELTLDNVSDVVIEKRRDRVQEKGTYLVIKIIYVSGEEFEFNLFGRGEIKITNENDHL